MKEWLVDRKRVPQDWRRRSSVRFKFSSAVALLPRNLDPFFQTLESDDLLPRHELVADYG